MVRRREILKAAVVLAAGQLVGLTPQAASGGARGATRAQDPRKLLITRGSRARRDFSPATPSRPSKDVLPPPWRSSATISTSRCGFARDHSLWGGAGLEFRLQFFHVGRGFAEPVHLYEVIDGQSREIVYDPEMFEFDKSGIDPGVMRDHAGFAGFRVQFVTNWKARRGCVSRRRLLSRGGRRHAAVWPVGARTGGGYRIPAARGIPALHVLLVRATGQGLGNHDAVCA